MNNIIEILEKNRFELLDKKIIGIGLGDNIQTNSRILHAVKSIKKDSVNQIFLVGKERDVLALKEKYEVPSDICTLITVDNPENYLIEKILKGKGEIIDKQENRLKNNNIIFDAIIRGGLSSSKFIKIIRKLKEQIYERSKIDRKPESNDHLTEDVPTSELIELEKMDRTYRLALLESSKQQQFFYAPVGIDEVNTKENKANFIRETINFLQSVNIPIKISLLSGGRKGDVGRDKYIDENIQSTDEIVQMLKKEFPSHDVELSHDYILIENTLYKKSTVIIAPDGISGNLIYRTLVHLGGGKAYGAVYLNIYNELKKLIIDTSRAAEQSEYEGAIKLALYIR